jgi:hypothetical protein
MQQTLKPLNSPYPFSCVTFHSYKTQQLHKYGETSPDINQCAEFLSQDWQEWVHKTEAMMAAKLNKNMNKD